jgi:hypothetical protein
MVGAESIALSGKLHEALTESPAPKRTDGSSFSSSERKT